MDWIFEKLVGLFCIAAAITAIFVGISYDLAPLASRVFVALCLFLLWYGVHFILRKPKKEVA